MIEIQVLNTNDLESDQEAAIAELSKRPHPLPRGINNWTPAPMFTTNPVADVGKVGFADFNGDGKLDFVTPIDRVNGVVKDESLRFTRK